jgi:hypothetical protein
VAGPNKFSTETKETDNSLSMTITREPNEDPDDTYFGAASQILSLPDEGLCGLSRKEAAEAIVKRYGHFEKLSVYGRILSYFGENLSEQARDFLKAKVETHKNFAHKPLDEQIYNRGKWLPEIHHCACGAVANCSEYKYGEEPRYHCSNCP